MNVEQLRDLLYAKFEGDYGRQARAMHFVGLLKAALDGLAEVGVVLNVETRGLERFLPLGSQQTIVATLDDAIMTVRGVNRHAADQKGR